jgi:hypothetical protein
MRDKKTTRDCYGKEMGMTGRWSRAGMNIRECYGGQSWSSHDTSTTMLLSVVGIKPPTVEFEDSARFWATIGEVKEEG